MAEGPQIRFLVPPPKPAPWWGTYGLATLVLLSFDGVAFAVFYRGTDQTLMPVMATAIMGLLGVAVGFFYQSSAGAREAAVAMMRSNDKKDELLATQSSVIAASPAVPPTTVVSSQGPATTRVGPATGGTP